MAQKVCVDLGCDDAELSLVICDDDEIRQLNARWRGKDTATDVLSFPQSEDETDAGWQIPKSEPPPRHLGDVVISAHRIAAQADEYGHSFGTELRRLLVHGILHLMGYDHERGEEDAEKMRREEERLLALLAREVELLDE